MESGANPHPLLFLTAVYLFIGLIQAFAIWLAREDRPFRLDELFYYMALWPILWLTPPLLDLWKTVWGNKVKFIKIYLAVIALSLILFTLYRWLL